MTSMVPPRRSPEEARRAVLRAETIGILVLAVLGFAIVILRYGRFIAWNAR